MEITQFEQALAVAHQLKRAELQLLVNEGVSLNMTNELGQSLALVLTMEGNTRGLAMLIELGIDVDYYDGVKSAQVVDQTPFLYAGAHGMNDALAILIKANADPAITNYYGGTALIPAAEKGLVKTVKLLLEQSNIDVNHVNDLGWTALTEAVILGDGSAKYQSVVLSLLAHGADVHIKDRDGVNVLEHAKSKGHTEIVNILKRYSAKTH